MTDDLIRPPAAESQPPTRSSRRRRELVPAFPDRSGPNTRDHVKVAARIGETCASQSVARLFAWSSPCLRTPCDEPFRQASPGLDQDTRSPFRARIRDGSGGSTRRELT